MEIAHPNLLVVVGAAANIPPLFDFFAEAKNAFQVLAAEFVNTDVYALAVFDAPENRPDMCKRADPDNPVCQLMGRYTLHLGPYYNSRPMTRHMAESCPSKPPLYHRPPGC